jgi:hypothetical protein
MSILWAGGEDIDFSLPTWNFGIAGHFRTTYNARVAISAQTGCIIKSKPFPGGVVTSCWFAFYAYQATGISPTVNTGRIGLGLSGTNKGLFVGHGSSGSKVALLKYDGTTWTVLASEAGTSMGSGVTHRFDMHVVDYGSSATVNIYLDGASGAFVTYAGDITVAGVSNLDSVFLFTTSTNYRWEASEMFVLDEDSRSFGLVTLPLDGAGDLEEWTGAFSAIDDIALDDSDLIYTNTNNKNQQANLGALPVGTYSIHGVKVSVRFAKSSDSTPGTLKVGIKSGSVDVDAGHAGAVLWNTAERYMTINPITLEQFTPTEINALQIDLQSAA